MVEGAWPAGARAALAGELRELGRRDPAASGIRRFYFRRHFPVDTRHNAKIHRLALAGLGGKEGELCRNRLTSNT